MKWYFQALTWLMLCAAGAAFATPPGNIKAVYDVYKGTLKVGQITEVYSRNKDHYALTSTTRAVGLLALFLPGKISIKSNGLVFDRGLLPLSFSDHRDGDENRNHRAEFDWPGKKLTLIHESQSLVVALPDGTQDRLSAMYQFMFLPLEKSELLSFKMTNGSKVDVYNYHITPNQSVTVPLGTFKALYLASTPEADASRTEIWLAAEHNNFPYKMIITDRDGSKFTQILTNIDFAL
jgi:hypothetical protein